MSGDILFPKVALLLQGDSFLDRSYSQAEVQYGPVTLTTAFAGVIPSSFWFKNTFTDTPFQVAHAAAAVVDAGEDFTVEVSAYCQRNPLGGILFSNRTPGGVANGLTMGLEPGGRPFVRVIHNGILVLVLDGRYAVTNDALHTFKVHRKAGIWGLSVDGRPQYDLGHQPVYNGDIQHGAQLYIGCDPYATGFVGGINQVRMTVGAARQTGAYTPEIIPWAIYATAPNILFGSLSTNITTRNNAVLIDVAIEHAAAVSVAAVDGAGGAVGSGWAIVPYPNGGLNDYRITGVAPAALADYQLVITGTTAESYGSLDKAQSYRLYNTQAGSLSAEQNLLATIGNTKLWLDASDLTTLASTGNNVNQILNKIDSLPFNAVSGQPTPILDTTSFARNAVRFIQNAASGFEASVPVVLSDINSNSVVILVGRYVGQNVGQANGQFQISYTDSNVPTPGNGTWDLTVTGVGENDANVGMFDASVLQNGVRTNGLLSPGQAFVIAWDTGSNRTTIWVNQRIVAINESMGTLGFWSAAQTAVRFIGGAHSPAGSFISLAELIAFDGQLSEAQLETVMSYVNHKWLIYPNVPFSQTPSTLSGYIGNLYTATTILTDTTSVAVVGSAGSGWAIEPSGSAVPGEYVITGILPTTVQSLTLTINTDNDGIAGVDVYTLQALALPSTPTILTPLSLQAQAGAGFATLLYVFSADTVNIIGSMGSDWSITPAAQNDNGNYLITGIAPDLIGSFTLTITASKLDTASGLVVTATRQFTIVVSANLVLEPDQYPIDLTGLLPSNRIVQEGQTLTPANGVKHQLLIPTFAPFFADSFRLSHYSAAGVLVDLVAGVDYVAVMEQTQLSKLCAAKVYSGINVLRSDVRGAVFLNYQTLGGSFGVDHQAMLEDLARVSHDSRFVAWDAVTGKPVYFPVTEHYLSIQEDTIGFAGLVAALEGLRGALSNLSETDVVTLNAHILSLSNPHTTTKLQVGLGNVQNYPLASLGEAAAGTSSQRYLTPKTARIAIDSNLPHAADNTAGVFYLNLGEMIGDDTDSTKPLTGLGVVNMLISPVDNALNLLFASGINQAEQTAQVSPFPMVFPLWWKGQQFATFSALASAVRSYTGILNLRYKASLGTFYFPIGYTVPSLVTTQAYSGMGAVNSTVMSPVDMPMLMST